MTFIENRGRNEFDGLPEREPPENPNAYDEWADRMEDRAESDAAGRMMDELWTDVGGEG